MALFMPSNITPSTLGELGSGTVDVSNGLTVSWQVNGQSAMTAFQVRIFENTASSKQLYTTGKRTDNCPFYGVNEKGESESFSYTIPASTLNAAGVSNGNSYKLSITQWWSDSDSVTQQSASVFVCRSTPVLVISGYGSKNTVYPISTTKASFSASYTQEQGDSLMWVRWRVWSNADEHMTLLSDTGNVSTSVLGFSYDGFLSGESYLLRCDVETINGVQTYAEARLSAQYDVAGFEGTVSATLVKGKSGVLVEWPDAAQIQGSAEGPYRITGGELLLPAGSTLQWERPDTVSWDTSDGFVWAGKLEALPATVLEFFTGESEGADNDPFSLTVSATGISLARGDTEIAGLVGTFMQGYDMVIALTGGMMYVRATHEQGMYPQNALYPADLLLPQQSAIITETYTTPAPLSSDVVYSVAVAGPQVCDYVWLLRNGVPESILNDLMGISGYTPAFDADTLLLADFSTGIDGGNIQTSEQIVAWRIYRAVEDQSALRLVSETISNSRSIIDCAVPSQVSCSYFVFGVSAEGNIVTQALRSAAIYVCFWDWTILMCGETAAAGGGYEVEDIFRFSLNVESGTVGNNNTPSVLENFTRYPTVQMTPQRYASGTLSGYLGSVGADGEYSDTAQRRDALFQLSQWGGTLFLKNRKGDFWKVAVSGQITCRTQDATRQQAQICAVPWVEIGDASQDSITIRKESELWDI